MFMIKYFKRNIYVYQRKYVLKYPYQANYSMVYLSFSNSHCGYDGASTLYLFMTLTSISGKTVSGT